MDRNQINRRVGFTLVELMIVVAIIGVLASVAIPSFINYQMSSKRAEAFANLSSLAKAQKTYFAEFNEFVPVLSEPSSAGTLPNTEKRSKAPLDTAFAVVGWVPEGDVFFDYDTATADEPWTANCGTCSDSCFTATAYGNLDGDAEQSMITYAQPDSTGEYCTTGIHSKEPNVLGLGTRMLSTVIRVNDSDDF